ncbi:hypothetical protein BAUCODRAFT_32397 [Baudoinia panamericana UAMH 10762]|uniref:Uncharacterized protein n=1 Tax=Baudoinia panamericana (strain UAMH 10762) TaxID=717646 RepID=M2NGC9_BAUPA|nr:uncharacterized protein BAUCODRAFT_32397 [Baudoinia panamericana UAMH 10762]EMC98364.1 hypothetical protein BAUCODRAFT_32397 [Baudoinia panamericana UAMH 10762]
MEVEEELQGLLLHASVVSEAKRELSSPITTSAQLRPGVYSRKDHHTSRTREIAFGTASSVRSVQGHTMVGTSWHPKPRPYRPASAPPVKPEPAFRVWNVEHIWRQWCESTLRTVSATAWLEATFVLRLVPAWMF